MKRVLLAVLSLALVGCKPDPVAPPPPGTETCATACANLRAHACPVGSPTKTGATCETVCANSRNNGVAWPLACLTSTASCNDCGQ